MNMNKSFLGSILVILTLSGIMAGCTNTTSNTPDECATGSFESITITHEGKYAITYYSDSTGHPQAEYDFVTDMAYSFDDGKVMTNVYFYFSSGENVEEAVSDYNDLEETSIGDKNFKVVEREGSGLLYYKIDDEHYLRIELPIVAQFDQTGNYTDISYSVSDLISLGAYDDVIIFDVKIK